MQPTFILCLHDKCLYSITPSTFLLAFASHSYPEHTVSCFVGRLQCDRGDVGFVSLQLSTSHLGHESGWGDGGGACADVGGQRSQSAWRGVVYWTQSRSPRLRSGRKKGRLGENHRLVMHHTSDSNSNQQVYCSMVL